jgi:hypothetical protein
MYLFIILSEFIFCKNYKNSIFLEKAYYNNYAT